MAMGRNTEPLDYHRLCARLEAAAEIAVSEMVDLICERRSVDRVEAFILISAAGDVRVNQACRANIDTSVWVEFPKLT